MADPDPAAAPLEPTVHRVHDRYLKEVVEDLRLCPFARRCRETGRLHRPIFHVSDGQPAPAECAERLAALCGEHPDLEVVLLTFLLPGGHALWDPDRFQRFLREVQAQVEGGCPVRFYLVGFHPASWSAVPASALRPHSLAPLLRRTPDPVIQCVRADLLDRVREDPSPWIRLLDGEPDPEVRALLAGTLPATSPVSEEIARQNFLRVGGDGQKELEERLADIQADRDRSYALGSAADSLLGSRDHVRPSRTRHR